MCQEVLIREIQSAATVEGLKKMIGDGLVIHSAYRNQEIPPNACLCCVDLEATAKSCGYKIGKYAEYTVLVTKSDEVLASALAPIENPAMRFKAKFSGITDLEPRKHEIEVVDIEDHKEIVSALLAALEEGVKLYGKPGGPWNMPSQPGSWIEMAQNAIAKAKGGAE